MNDSGKKMKDTNVSSDENIGIHTGELIKELSEAFYKAEKTVKAQELQLLEEGLLVPAVNQLRYVASHLIRVLDHNDKSTVEKNLRCAIGHCHCAIFDALEVPVRYYLGECDMFTDQFKSILSANVIPSYLEDKAIVDDIREFIPPMRRAENQRHQHWEEMESHLSRLKEIAKKWNAKRPELNKKINNERRFLMQCLISIAAIVVAIVVGLTVFWKT